MLLKDRIKLIFELLFVNDEIGEELVSW